MIPMTDMLKALSLECLTVSTVADTKRNQGIFKALDELDEEYKSCDCKSERIPILAEVFDLCLMMDMIN